jgi:hypothetical protein
MASVTLSQANEYRLVHEDQDWHGWPVHDAGGNQLGRVTDFIIDTDASRAVALVLDTGSEIPVDDVLVGDQSLIVWGGGAEPPAGTQSLQAFENGTLDVMEHVERAVFRKRPIVVEELLISHDVVERKARIQTTLKRVDVDVERLPETPTR